jgi:hypothetical protein
MADASRPEDVRLIDPNGEVWPCSVALLGQDREGIYHWMATPVGLSKEEARAKFSNRRGHWQMAMAMLPARTAITVGFPEGA